MTFKCDYKGCKRLPYAEIYPLRYDDEVKGYIIDSERGWSYLCFWHYLYTKYILRDKYGLVKVERERRKIHKLLYKLAKKRMKRENDFRKYIGVETRDDIEDFIISILEEIKDEIVRE